MAKFSETLYNAQGEAVKTVEWEEIISVEAKQTLGWDEDYVPDAV